MSLSMLNLNRPVFAGQTRAKRNIIFLTLQETGHLRGCTQAPGAHPLKTETLRYWKIDDSVNI